MNKKEDKNIFNRYNFAVALVACSVGAAAEVPRMRWGAPDLQGVWTAATVTPLERPLLLEDKAFLTQEERQIIEKEREEFLLKL